jgi:hypothetical protein
MKNNIKSLQLVEMGIPSKTVARLSESQINILHKKMVKEEVKKTVTNITFDPTNTSDQQKLAQKGIHIDPNTKKITMSTSGGEITTEEMTEDETDDVTDQNAQGKDDLQKLTGQETPHDANDMAPDGMDDDSDDNRKMMGMSEARKVNPWQVCTAQMGKEFGTTKRSDWTKSQMKKYEDCVMGVKKQKNSLKENKKSVSLFLENEIMKIVERNLPPRITKGELMKYLSESEPATKEPGTKERPGTKEPGTKETPRERPKHPGKKPEGQPNPAPKAISPEKAKNEVIDLIINLLEK